MNLQGRNLSHGVRGDDVRLLHTELGQLGFAIPDRELREAQFGEGTRDAVLKFQEANRIRPTGEVDETTAKAINTQVEDLRPRPATADTGTPLIVRGSVRASGGTPSSGILVRAFDKDMRGAELIGEAQTDQSGHYEIRYTAERLKRAEKGSADLIVRAYDANDQEIGTSFPLITFNAHPVETIDLNVGTRMPSEFERFIAELTPLLQDVPLHELTEDDIDFLVGDTGIDRQLIDWLVQAARVAHESPSLSVGTITVASHALTPPSQNIILATALYAWFRQALPTDLAELLGLQQDILRAAIERSARDNIIPSLSTREMEDAISGLRAYQATLMLKPAQENEPASVGDLLKTTQLSPEKHLTIATLQLEHGAGSEDFWNALKQSSDFSEKEMNSVRLTLQLGEITGNNLPLIAELERTTREAKGDGLRHLAKLDVNDWKVLLLKPQGSVGPIAPPPGTPGDTLEDRVNNHAALLTRQIEDLIPTPAIASRLERDTADDSPFASTRSDLKIFFDNNPSFEFRNTPVDLYLNEGRDEKLRDVSEPKALLTDLKKMQRVFNIAPRYSEIRALLDDDLHSAMKIVHLGERRFTENYAGPLGGPGNALDVYRKAEQVHGTALTLYMKHAPAFNEPLPYAIAGDAPGSAMAFSIRSDLPEWSTLFGSLDLCDCQHCKSLYSPAAYFVDILRFLNDGPTKDGQTPLQALLNRRPDLEHIELTCENTNTQLPYIDLVKEILEASVTPWFFVIPEGTDINALFADLNALKLPASLKTGFANKGYPLTDNASLRIDKVPGAANDFRRWIILDTGLAFELNYQGTNEGFRVLPWPQTSWTADELRANPEHTHDAAYMLLRRAVYPWDLPLNLPVEEMRVYLRRLGVECHELMETFFRGPLASVVNNDAIAQEYLGLTKEEADIITGVTTGAAPGATPPPGPWNFYGLSEFVNNLIDTTDGSMPGATGDWDVVLRRVSIFLQQSSLRYAELLELLGTRFINPPNANGVRPFGIVSTDPENPATCARSKLEIQVIDSAIPVADRKNRIIEVWNKIHRFVRLWKKLGWTMRDLDKAIAALQPQNSAGRRDLTGPFLAQLSHIQRLRTQFRLPVVNLLSWWANIDTQNYVDHLTNGEPAVSSLYTNLFDNNSAAGQSLGANPASLSGNMSQNAATIAAALQISATDFTLLKSNPNVIPRVPDPANPQNTIQDDSLSLTNLSRLYRHAAFARALKHPIRTYLSTLDLIAPNPFATTADTLRFAEQVDKIRGSGFKVEELDYLLRHQFPPASSIAITDEAIALVLDSLRDGLRKIIAENTLIEASSDASAATTDPNGDLTRTKLALLNWDTTVIEQIIAVLSGTFSYQADLAVFPGNLIIPNALKNKLSYDAVGARLKFTGIMTAAERTSLTQLQNASNEFQTAVQNLFEGPKRIVSHHMRRFSVPRFEVTLDDLPTDLRIPEALKDKFYYDAGKLYFIGVMTESERSLLTNLSADTTYKSKITTLYNAADNTAPPSTDVFLTTGQTNSDLFELFDVPNSTAQSRFLVVLRQLLPYLRGTLSERFVVQHIAEFLQLDSTSTRELLIEWINSSAPAGGEAIDDFLAPSFSESNPNVESTREAFPNQFTTVSLLYKVAVIGRKFKLTKQQFEWLFEYGPGNSWLSLNALPLGPISAAHPLYKAWSRIVDLFKLSDALPLGEPLLDDLFKTARAPLTQLDALLRKLSVGVQWELSDLQALNGTGGFNFSVSAYNDEAAMLRLVAALDMMKRLGASASQCLTWTEAVVTDSDAAKRARDIKSLVRARLDQSEWLEAAKALHDPLREKQRAALVSYLATQRQVRSSDELYDDFLIDVEMSPCMMTTRIKQAISSVQLFVQRSLMNLEADVSLSQVEAEEWAKWRKQYRIWEANRKVLLYAENWIKPELRDDKSPFFKELESELLQDDVTTDSAETAFLHYLEKLNEVARLEIVGLYHEREPQTGTSAGVDVLHVFGRTFATPHIYYYRRRTANGSWTAWEKVEADVQGNHIIPLIWNRRLYLFWATFSKKQQEVPLTMPEPGGAMATGKKIWEIQLSWAEFKNGKWSAKKQSQPYLANHPNLNSDIDESEFTFKSRVADDLPAGEQQLFLDCYGPASVMRPAQTSTAVKESLLFSLNKRLTEYAFAPAASVQIRLNGNVFPAEALNNVEIVVRRASNKQEIERLELNADWREILNDEVGSQKNYYLSSAAYEVVAINPAPKRQITQLLPRSGGGEARELSRLELAYTVNLSATTIPATLSAGIMHLVSIPFDDSKGNIGEPLIVSSPTMLEPLAGTRFVNMMMVETVNFGNALGTSQLLKQTPGTFRVLTPHQIYQPRNLSLPFFYQDELRTYLATYVPPTNGSDSWRVRFNTFRHPSVAPFIKSLNRLGVRGLLTLGNQRLLDAPLAFDRYRPNTRVDSRLPREDIDFSPEGAYSTYNWELFFHVPFLVASRLSDNQRFEEAQKWFQYIFDPTATDSPDNATSPGPERFWRVKPFYDQAMGGIQTLGDLLSEGTDLQEQVREWRANPFNPHAVARLRHVAFMKAVVMRYVDNLIAWGDQLFRRGTIESTNEATQLYVLAAQILGKRPERIPARAEPKVQTFRTLDDESALDSMSNAVVEIESFLPPSSAPTANTPGTPSGAALPMPFFCITSNDKLLGYWDTVADRLFKIRHCLNIEGVATALPIFDSPIDPGLLVKAAAAGVDISSALNDINAALPHYRFNIIQQKAVDLCNDVRVLGGALLATLEKRDAEGLALLRSTQEIKVLNAVRAIREKQIEEVQATREALLKSKEMTTIRRDYYRDIKFMNEWEIAHLSLAGASLSLQAVEIITHALAGTLHLIPNTKVGVPTSLGVTYGGDNVGPSIREFSESIGKVVSILNASAQMASTVGGHQRRFDDWKLQERVAEKEIEQIDKQIAAGDIRKAIAEKELANHDIQIENSKEVDEYLRNKFTNRELYDWMVGQIAGIYFQSYQLAYDVAKRAERAYRYELGLRDSNFIQFGYWDSLKKGLMCGERLHHDLKRLEISYLDQNKREYEITKHISLNLIDPLSLMKLKETGECFVSLPEALFDIDYPGHYMRRVRSVGVTIPCITGPYAGVNCTLTLQSSSIRHANTLLAGAYSRQADDTRFTDNFGSIQSIVTSSGQNDSGLFDANMRDERYLPFEGQGAISTWRIQLPRNFPSFDYDTISDVVLHLRYTAREGGDVLRTPATSELQVAVNQFVQREGQQGLARVFSMRHEFSTEWHRFLNPSAATEATLDFTLAQDRFPFQFRGRTIQIRSADIFLKFKDINDPVLFTESPSNPTPLGDYMDSGSNIIQMDLTPPATTALTLSLNSSLSFLNGLPHGVQGFSSTPGGPRLGSWSLKLRDVTNSPSPLSLWSKRAGANRWRLKPDLIEDIFVAFRYSI